MGPNETLRRIRELQARLQGGHPDDDMHPYSVGDMLTMGQELVLLTRDLDEWITKGGFLPTVWNASHPPF